MCSYLLSLSYLILLLFTATAAVLFLARVSGVFATQPRLRPLIQWRQFLTTVVVVIESVRGGRGWAVAVATAVDVVIGDIVFLALLSL